VKKIIGNRIRKLREGKDYSQDNMGVELGITAGAYAKIERGESDPSATRLVRIAEILGVEVAVFFQDAPTQVNAEDDIKKYGIATKQDLASIQDLILALKNEVDNLKTEIKQVKEARPIKEAEVKQPKQIKPISKTK
jgi:transcriptional regulator with XRE-family HTH domain